MKSLIMVILFPFLLAFSGCRAAEPPRSPAEEAVRNQVAAYAALLAEGYETLNMNHLLQAATGERALKAFYHMAALGEARVRMVADPEEILFAEISFPEENLALVRTREKWSYQYRDVDTGAERFANRADYTMLYTLLRENGVWLVAEAEIEQAGEEKPAIELERFFQRPPSDPFPFAGGTQEGEERNDGPEKGM